MCYPLPHKFSWGSLSYIFKPLQRIESWRFLGEIGLSMNSPSVDPIVDIKKRVATSRGSTTGDRHEKCYERRANRVLDEICSKNCPENAARRVQRAPRTMS